MKDNGYGPPGSDNLYLLGNPISLMIILDGELVPARIRSLAGIIRKLTVAVTIRLSKVLSPTCQSTTLKMDQCSVGFLNHLACARLP